MNNKPIKIVPKNNGIIYFFSDAHLNHDRPWIVEKRGFKNVQEHDEWILDQLYNLKEDDILINLGDFSLMSTVEYTDNVLANIKATHYYINGNHESFMSKIYFREVANNFLDIPEKTEVYPLVYYPRWKKTPMIFMGESATFKINNDIIYCRHMATLIWEKMKYDNNICLIGHSHGSLKCATVQSKEPKMLDVGIDNAKIYNNSCFFSSQDITEIMKFKKIKTFDHHGTP